MRGFLNKLVSRSLSVAGKWQHQQLRRLNIHEYQVSLSLSLSSSSLLILDCDFLDESCENSFSFF
jgi:hypothetical protein